MASSGGVQQQQQQQQQQQGQQHGYNLQSQASAPAGFPLMQHSPAAAGGGAASSQIMSPTKEYNSVNMCHIGQEIVHEIVTKAQEIFTFLSPKSLQLPTNPTQHHYYSEKLKLEEHLKQINITFRKLRIFYSKVNEAYDQIIEPPTEKELVPLTGKESDISIYQTETYRLTLEQHKDMVEQVRLKNQELKEVVDSIRSIIWEINTMITMRKTL